MWKNYSSTSHVTTRWWLGHHNHIGTVRSYIDATSIPGEVSGPVSDTTQVSFLTSPLCGKPTVVVSPASPDLEKSFWKRGSSSPEISSRFTRTWMQWSTSSSSFSKIPTSYVCSPCGLDYLTYTHSETHPSSKEVTITLYVSNTTDLGVWCLTMTTEHTNHRIVPFWSLHCTTSRVTDHWVTETKCRNEYIRKNSNTNS